MEILIYIAALFVIYYVLQIILLIYGNLKIKPFISKEFDPATKFSILIPFKDEEVNLQDLLESFSKLNYPKDLFELLFINDSSVDNSLQIINSWRFKNPYIQVTILDNVVVSNSPKKDAITRAQTIAKFPWILTTDADCVLPENILLTYNSLLNENKEKEFFVGGVKIKSTSGILNAYQHLDMAALQAVTIGSFGIEEPFMCNGANLLYKKDLFKKVNGYVGVNHIASGDDVFLLEKVLALNPNLIMYAKHPDLIIDTQPVITWKKLLSQRVRWAKKSKNYKTIYPKILGIITIGVNVSFLIGILGLSYHFSFALSILILKLMIDFVLLRCYKNLTKVNFTYLAIIQVLYPFVLILIIINVYCTKLKWKNRYIN